MAYYRCIGGGSPQPQPQPSESVRLCYVEYVMNDSVEIPTIDTIDTSSTYSSYLSYDSTTKKFTVLQPFTALITAWVEQKNNANNSAKGEFYLNNKLVIGIFETPLTTAGSKGGDTKCFNLSPGDTFYSYTPSNKGWPEQRLKVYKTDLSNATDIFEFDDENT